MKKKKFGFGQIILHMIFVLICVTYVVPLLLMISVSFTSESSIAAEGYRLIPAEFSVDAYNLVFKNPKQIIDSYVVTAVSSLTATFLALLFTSMISYSLSRRIFRMRNALTFYVFFTMLFNGGMVPSYLLITKYLHLGNTIWVHIIPGLIGAWNVIVLRTSFQAIPESLIESAKIDGASEFLIFFRIMLPLVKSTLAAIGFLFFVPHWNDWMRTMLYIDDPSLYTLQYLLQRLLKETEYLKSLAESGSTGGDVGEMLPTESFKFAMAIVAAGPVMFLFPIFQKYFSKGITIGAVKG